MFCIIKQFYDYFSAQECRIREAKTYVVTADHGKEPTYEQYTRFSVKQHTVYSDIFYHPMALLSAICMNLFVKNGGRNKMAYILQMWFWHTY